MKRQIMRRKGNRFCRLEIELRDGRLSLCGTEGRVVKRKQAKTEALEYWASFFEDNLTELHAMNALVGRYFRTARSAAKFVLASDGEFHGLDIVCDEGAEVFVLESRGQIREELAAWFPECKPYLHWHLNDMHAECEHQEARGETWQTHPSAVCPDCGYKLGAAWTKRELPAHVIEWATTFGLEAEVA